MVVAVLKAVLMVGTTMTVEMMVTVVATTVLVDLVPVLTAVVVAAVLAEVLVAVMAVAVMATVVVATEVEVVDAIEDAEASILIDLNRPPFQQDPIKVPYDAPTALAMTVLTVAEEVVVLDLTVAVVVDFLVATDLEAVVDSIAIRDLIAEAVAATKEDEVVAAAEVAVVANSVVDLAAVRHKMMLHASFIRVTIQI